MCEPTSVRHFCPAFEAIVGALGKFSDFAARNSEVMVALGTGFAVVTGAIVAMSIALKVMAVAASVAAAKLTLFGIALSATGIGAIVVDWVAGECVGVGCDEVGRIPQGSGNPGQRRNRRV
jgi:hypothetical protein